MVFLIVTSRLRRVMSVFGPLWLLFDFVLVGCALWWCLCLIHVAEVVALLQMVVGDDFRRLHWLNFGNQIVFCLRLRCEEDSFCENSSQQCGYGV